MSVTPEARVRTRALACVIGPFLVIVTTIVAVRMPDRGTLLTAFFENPTVVWMVDAMLLLGGLLIIAHHEYWPGLSAILISLIGWFVALRGMVLLAAAPLVARGVAAAQIFFGFLVLIGLWLTLAGRIARPTAAS